MLSFARYQYQWYILYISLVISYASCATIVTSPPVTASATLDNSQQRLCDSSWSFFFEESARRVESKKQSFGDSRIERKTGAPYILTDWIITLQSFGPNTTSTECDGVPRLKFLGKPTSSRLTSFVRSHTASEIEIHDMEIPVRFESNHTANLNTSAIQNLVIIPDPPNCKLDMQKCKEILAGFTDAFGSRKNSGIPSFDGRFPEFFELACPLTFLEPSSGLCNVELGREVVLLYWPPNMESRNICDSNGIQTTYDRPSSEIKIRTTAIEFHGQDLWSQDLFMPESSLDSEQLSSWIETKDAGPTTIYGDWTLVYPTVYLAHHAISLVRAYDSGMDENGKRKGVGSSITRLATAGVIPLAPEDVFSVMIRQPEFAAKDLSFVNQVVRGKYLTQHTTTYYSPNWTTGNSLKLETAQFNFGNLPNPVPASEYFRMKEDCWGYQTHCGTITDDSYRPTLSIRDQVWSSILRDELPCNLPVLVDPPINIRRIENSGDEPQRLPSQSFTVVDLPISSTTPSAQYGTQGGSLGSGLRAGHDIIPPQQRPVMSAATPSSTRIPTQALNSAPTTGSGDRGNGGRFGPHKQPSEASTGSRNPGNGERIDYPKQNAKVSTGDACTSSFGTLFLFLALFISGWNAL